MENKTLKTLEIEVTYKIGLHNIELPAQVHDALVGLYEMDITELDVDVPHGVSDFSKCYDLVTFCEVTKEELQKVVEAFPYYKPIIDEWNNLASAVTKFKQMYR